VEDCGWNNCVSGAWCGNGTCEPSPWPSPNVGQACSSDNAYCQTGYCDLGDGGTTGVCRPPPGLGAPCANGYLCDPALTCANGICQGPPAAGEPCSGNFGLACRPGDYCDMSGSCQPQAQLGAPCDRSVQMPTCAEGTCDATGHCAPLLPPGAACTYGAFECSTHYTSCAIDSTPSGGSVWYCDDPACSYATDGGSGTFCASACQ
jgi:hypothetical protein